MSNPNYGGDLSPLNPENGVRLTWHDPEPLSDAWFDALYRGAGHEHREVAAAALEWAAEQTQWMEPGWLVDPDTLTAKAAEIRGG